MLDKLKPCPFCGAKLEIRKNWYPASGKDAYVHPSNGCILSNFDTGNGFSTDGEEVKKWNERSVEAVAKLIADSLSDSKNMNMCPCCSHKDVCKFVGEPGRSCDKFINDGAYKRYGNIYDMFDGIFDWLKFHYPHGEVYFVVDSTRAKMYQEHGPHISDRETRQITRGIVPKIDAVKMKREENDA